MSDAGASDADPHADLRLVVREQGVAGYATLLRQRVRSGDVGPVAVVVGLVVIWAIFQSLNSNFLTAGNLSNLAVQSAATGTIAVGVVLVLLLGEIDLSVGSVSGLAAAILAVLNVNQGVPVVPAIALALLAGAVIGALHGLVVTRLGVPSFVVTLAGLIGWQGAQLYVLGDQGTINFPFDGPVSTLANTYFAGWIGWAIGIVLVAGYGLSALAARRRRAGAGLVVRPYTDLALRVALLAIAIFAGIAVLDQARGVPLALLIFVGLVVAFDLMLRRTRYGRNIFAVGGNAEAARRAGIDVGRVKVTVFVLASTLAAAGGVLAASRLFAVNQASGSNDILLNAIAAAVIGGTSLFGGRGSTYAALLGILVIQSISNGMFLLQVDSDIRFMITGAVLLAAVVIDAVSRRGQAAPGR